MKKFLIKIFVFSIPGLLWLIPPVIILKLSGESYTQIDDIIHQKKKYLIGYAYNEDNYKYLKWKEINRKAGQDVLALGSSRILQLREGMFQSSFYNAGYTITSISEFVPFLRGIPKTKYPRVLIVSLDQWMFNENSDQLVKSVPSSTWENSFKKYASFKTLKNIWSDLLIRKYGFSNLMEKAGNEDLKKVGLNAFVNNQGFRNDGSFSYGNQIVKLISRDSTADDYNYNNTFERIDNGNMRFEYGHQINSKALKELEDFLKFCGNNKIKVIAILPPFANKVNEHLKNNGRYQYMDKIHPAANEIFIKYGFEFWDMSELSKYGSGDNETIDGFHGGEVCYLKMLIYMIENDSAIKSHTDLNGLKERLSRRKNDYEAFEY